MPNEFSYKPEGGNNPRRPASPGSKDGREKGRFPGKGDGDGQRVSLTDEIIKLDAELVRLIARRSKLVNKMRGGKKHASTPKSIKAEKEVRAAWEENSTKFSRDPHFVRQLFNLLQDVEIQTLEEAKELSAFKLAPARKPLALELPGPASGVAVRLWALLGAVAGVDLTLTPVLRNDVAADFVKALNQLGGKLSWPSPDILRNAGGEPLSFAEKTVYAGEDFLSFCLLAFTALNQPGRVRFTGGSGLKSADMSALRHFMPDLGARLAHVVPGSNGLPATLECSGVLPRSVTVPATLPLEAFVALLLAARIWNVDFTVNYGDLPAETASTGLALVSTICREAGAEFAISGGSVHFTGGDLKAESIPAQPGLIMDSALAATLLALPFFTGGQVELSGVWPDFMPDSAVAFGMLMQFGLEVKSHAGGIRSSQPRSSAFIDITHDAERLPPRLLPLFMALAAASAKKSATGVPFPRLPEEADPDMAQDFFSQLGLAEQDGRLVSVQGLEKEASAARPYGWTSPGPLWTLAFSLCAFLKPNLKLSNPGSATEVMPGYWGFYNSLPNPEKEKPVKEAEHGKPVRRRIIAGD